jgi:hypothetical protein
MKTQQANKLKVAQEMCHYYFFKYYITHKYPDTLDYTSLKEREKAFMYSYKNDKSDKCFYDRNLKYFLIVAGKFANREEFDAKGFIDAVVSENFQYPAQLENDKNWKLFLRNSQRNEIATSSSIETAKAVKSFFTFLNGRSIRDITESIILKNDLLEEYANETLDLSVLCFSKAFKELAEKENMVIDFYEEQSKIDPRIKEKIKEKIGDDFFEEKE